MSVEGVQYYWFDPKDRQPRDLTWDGEHLWMMNANGIVKQYATEGTLLDSMTTSLPYGWGLTYGEGYLWASDPSRNRIYQINLPPRTFTLLSPEDGSVVHSDTIHFDWEASTDPDSLRYCFLLSSDSTFEDTTTLMVDSLQESHYTLAVGGSVWLGMRGLGSRGKLTPDTTYYWRVKAYDGWGAERWSEMWTFSFRECVCGDGNCDGRITVADATYLISYIYREGTHPIGDGDVNVDGRITVADATYIVSYVYRGGPPPGQPSLGSTGIVRETHTGRRP